MPAPWVNVVLLFQVRGPQWEGWGRDASVASQLAQRAQRRSIFIGGSGWSGPRSSVSQAGLGRIFNQEFRVWKVNIILVAVLVYDLTEAVNVLDAFAAASDSCSCCWTAVMSDKKYVWYVLSCLLKQLYTHPTCHHPTQCCGFLNSFFCWWCYSLAIEHKSHWRHDSLTHIHQYRARSECH